MVDTYFATTNYFFPLIPPSYLNSYMNSMTLYKEDTLDLPEHSNGLTLISLRKESVGMLNNMFRTVSFAKSASQLIMLLIGCFNL